MFSRDYLEGICILRWYFEKSAWSVLDLLLIFFCVDVEWFSLAQSVRSRTMNLFNWLYWSSAFESDPELSVRKLHILWGCELLELGLGQMQAAISLLTPGSPGSDLNSVVRTDCICSVKCAEAAELQVREAQCTINLLHFLFNWWVSTMPRGCNDKKNTLWRSSL